MNTEEFKNYLRAVGLASRQLDIPFEYSDSIQRVKKYLKLKEIFKLI